MKPSSLGKQPEAFWLLHGHYEVTTRSLRFGFMNGSFRTDTRIILFALRGAFQIQFRFDFVFIMVISSRDSDHFGRVCVVPFQIRFRYVSKCFMNGSSSSRYGSFWSRMLRGCILDSVSLVSFS